MDLVEMSIANNFIFHALLKNGKKPIYLNFQDRTLL